MIVGDFAPFRAARTGVADYAAALLPALGEFCEVREGEAGAACLYHIGNNQLHRPIYEEALRVPGVAVLHDAVLHHLFLGWLGRQQYLDEFAYNYGDFCRAEAVLLWEERSRSAQDPRYFERAMVRRIAEVSRAVVVHNPGAARIVAVHASGARVEEIPHLFAPPELPSRRTVRRWREERGLGEDTFLFGVFGHLRESKRLAAVLRAFERVRDRGLQVGLLVSGGFVSSDLERALGQHLRGPGILRMPFCPEADFWIRASAVDACINLRYPAAGETSGIAVRLMGIGKPVLLSAGEENSRMPEDGCIRIDTGVAEEAMLIEYMVWLVQHPEDAREVGARGARRIAERHSPREAARRYWEVLSSCL